MIQSAFWRLVADDHCVVQFSARTPKLLLVGTIEKCCVSSVIQEIPQITRGLPAPSANPHIDKARYAVTEGSNLRAAWSFADGTGELKNLYSNDVAEILRVYGVEAARAAIIKEMSGVFGVYGIGVDYRHLTLIADYMVRAYLVPPLHVLTNPSRRRARAGTSHSTVPASRTTSHRSSKHRTKRPPPS